MGSGIKTAGEVDLAREAIGKTDIPVISSMLATDIIVEEDRFFGFIGAYGERAANFIAAKSDLIIALGARMDIRQVGARRENFAPGARILRFDIDENELAYKIHEDDITVCCHVREALELLSGLFAEDGGRPEWKNICLEIKKKLMGLDSMEASLFLRALNPYIDDDALITTDVGQNQVWVPQSLKLKKGQKILFSGGHGAMGYSLPAAIGACAAEGKRVFCFVGDGGLQMNIQELQVLARERLPIKVILFNNSSLGMIRHFQEMYFESRFIGTLAAGGYSVPDFAALAGAYGIGYRLLERPEDVSENIFTSVLPELIEIRLPDHTYVRPKLEFGKPNQDQEPLIDRELYNYLMSL